MGADATASARYVGWLADSTGGTGDWRAVVRLKSSLPADTSAGPDQSVANGEIVFIVSCDNRPAPPSGSSAECLVEGYEPGHVYHIATWPPPGIDHLEQ
jgi:hypothetical protein